MTVEQARELWNIACRRWSNTKDEIQKLLEDGKDAEADERAKSYAPDLRQVIIARNDLENAEREARNRL